MLCRHRSISCISRAALRSIQEYGADHDVNAPNAMAPCGVTFTPKEKLARADAATFAHRLMTAKVRNLSCSGGAERAPVKLQEHLWVARGSVNYQAESSPVRFILFGLERGILYGTIHDYD